MTTKPAAKPVDAEQFKIGMRSLAGAVCIITSTHAGHRYGMTATAVCSASADPPTVLICVNKLATTHGAIAKSKVFCANVLRADDWELSTSFSGADRRGALQVARLGEARHRLPGAHRRAGVVRLPRRRQARARHAHRVPGAGGAGAARQEGQAAALLRRPVRKARLA